MAADPRTLEEDDEELQEAGTSSGRRARAKAKQATLLKPDAEADPTSFDLATLEKELHTAVTEEGTRKRVDDMKKRAIKVAPSYDDFKNLVACARDDQKPIQSGEMETAFKTAPRPRNKGVKYTGSSKGSKAEKAARDFPSAKLASGTSTGPKNAMEFDRDWRRNCRTPQARLSYILNMTPSSIPVIFRTEISSDVIVGMAGACTECWSSATATSASAAGAGAVGATPKQADAGSGGGSAAAGAGGGAGAGAGTSAASNPAAAVGSETGAQVAHVLALFDVFPSLNRFHLTVKLLSKRDKQVLTSFFSLLETLAPDTDVAALSAKFLGPKPADA